MTEKKNTGRRKNARNRKRNGRNLEFFASVFGLAAIASRVSAANEEDPLFAALPVVDDLGDEGFCLTEIGGPVGAAPHIHGGGGSDGPFGSHLGHSRLASDPFASPFGSEGTHQHHAARHGGQPGDHGTGGREHGDHHGGSATHGTTSHHHHTNHHAAADAHNSHNDHMRHTPDSAGHAHAEHAPHVSASSNHMHDGAGASGGGNHHHQSGMHTAHAHNGMETPHGHEALAGEDEHAGPVGEGFAQVGHGPDNASDAGSILEAVLDPHHGHAGMEEVDVAATLAALDLGPLEEIPALDGGVL